MATADLTVIASRREAGSPRSELDERRAEAQTLAAEVRSVEQRLDDA